MGVYRTARRHLYTRVLATVVAVLGIAAISGDARAEDLTDLTLEQLLNTQLNAMAITGIHHTHEKGEWMLQYHYMRMGMDGNRDGTSDVSTGEVLARYPVSPTSMDMEMHMIHVMHAPTERLTVMAMVPYVRLTMDHKTRMGGTFTTDTDGIGDVKIAALFSAWRNERHRIVAEFGTSFPTGSIDEKGQTPMGFVQLPYPMQLGSGTFDLLPGATYLGQTENWAWGAHVDGVVRTGRNDNDYHLGHRFDGSTWIARKLLSFMSASVRLDAQIWGDISGADPKLNPRVVPTADPDLRGGRRLDVLLGLNLFALEGRLAGNRIGIEGGVPIYQSLDGPQLETDYRLSVAWDWTF